MARFNEILVGRFNRYLQKLTAIKGEVPSPELAGEIMPTIVIPTGVEDHYLQSWERFGTGQLVPAVVAAVSNFRLRNPAGSNVIAVVESVILAARTATQVFSIEVNTINTDLATVIAADARFDSRGRARSSLSISTGSGVAVSANPQGILRGLLDISFQVINTVNQEIILNPGRSLEIISADLNVAFNVLAWWRERFLEDSERT